MFDKDLSPGCFAEVEREEWELALSLHDTIESVLVLDRAASALWRPHAEL